MHIGTRSPSSPSLLAGTSGTERERGQDPPCAHQVHGPPGCSRFRCWRWEHTATGGPYNHGPGGREDNRWTPTETLTFHKS
jgi:hypothetical protein